MTYSPSKRSFAIAIAAFVARVAVSWFQPRPGYYWHTDSPLFWGNARSLLQSFRLANLDGGYPGYSLLLVPFVAAGVPPFWVVLLVHSAVGALSIVIAMDVTRRLSGERGALLAGLVLAFYPPLLNLNRQLITETTFVFFLLLAVWLLFRAGRASALLAGCASGMACLVRPPALGVLLVTAVLLAVRPAHRPRLVPYLAAASVFLVLGAWIENRSVDRVVVAAQARWADRIQPVLGGYRFLTAAEIAERGGYLGFLVRDPAGYVAERAISLATLLSPWPFDDGKRSPGNRLLVLLSDAFVYVLLGWALLTRPLRTWNPESWVVAAPVIGLVSFYGLLFAQPRYRWPFMPFLVCLAAAALTTEKRRAEPG